MKDLYSIEDIGNMEYKEIMEILELYKKDLLKMKEEKALENPYLQMAAMFSGLGGGTPNKNRR